VVRINWKIEFSQDFSRNRSRRAAEIKTVADWQETHVLVKQPLRNVEADFAIRFCRCDRIAQPKATRRSQMGSADFALD